jgi:hypothetical protein
MPRKISPDLINARLAPAPPSAYEEYAYGALPDENLPGREQEEQDDRGSISNFTFVALSLCLCLLAGGAVYYLAGGVQEGEKQQAAFWIDTQCGKDWGESLPNDTQLRCYLTTDVKRLCGPRERQHLVSVIGRHEKDNAAFERAIMMATISTIPQMQSRSVELGLASARVQESQKNNDMNGFDKNLGETLNITDDILKKPMELLQKARKTDLPSRELEAAITSLMSKGLLSTSDFGWFTPGLVKRAAEKVKQVKPVCG